MDILGRSTQSVPQVCFKVAKIVPVYKSNKRNDINNYRPISLLSEFSKLLEKIVYKRLSAFLIKHNILYELGYNLGLGKIDLLVKLLLY